MSLGRRTNEPAPALKVASPTVTSSSPSSTQKASSSRWWTWGGGPPPGGTTESVSAYAPPVSSLEALKVISSSATQSFLPSPSVTHRALGWFTSRTFLPSTGTHTLSLFDVGRKTRGRQDPRGLIRRGVETGLPVCIAIFFPRWPGPPRAQDSTARYYAASLC